MKHLEVGVKGLTQRVSKSVKERNALGIKGIKDVSPYQTVFYFDNNLRVVMQTNHLDDCEANVYFQYTSKFSGKVYDLSYYGDWGFLSEMPNEVDELKDIILSFLDGSLQDHFDKLEFINREANKGKIIQRLSYESVMKGGK